MYTHILMPDTLRITRFVSEKKINYKENTFTGQVKKILICRYPLKVTLNGERSKMCVYYWIQYES